MYSEDGVIRSVQEKSLEMLKYFHEFCEKNDLTYTLAEGTLLGAIRHQGFIPWDDDVDIYMPAEDIKRLMDIWEDRGDTETYFLQTKKSDPNLPGLFLRLRRNGTTSIDEKYKYLKLHWGLPIDIFPLYNIPENKILKKEMFCLRKLAHYSSMISFYFNNMPKLFLQTANLLSVAGFKNLLRKSGKNRNSKLVWSYGKNVFEKSIYFPIRDCKFESLDLKIPQNASLVLKQIYGEDFMLPPPPEKRTGHKGVIYDMDNDYKKYI